jgi:DNA/RNA-binding domain of Phe-tRNA-synthetase-like protein
VQLTIGAPFWALFPEAIIGVMVVRGVDNRRDAAAAETLLLQRAREAAERLGDADLSSHPAVAPWRAAYGTFGIKPSKHPSGIEGLLRSARVGRIRGINPLVDLYNAVSLSALLPCGGEDLAHVRGDVHLTRAVGDELFVPLGASEPQPPIAGEVVYRDDAGVLCRCWNWREAERTKLTAATTDALLVIEALPPVGVATVRAACDDLGALVRDHLGGAATVTILDRATPTMTLAA